MSQAELCVRNTVMNIDIVCLRSHSHSGRQVINRKTDMWHIYIHTQTYT